MTAVRVPFLRVGEIDVPLPAYQTADAAGMDVHAALRAPVTLKPLERKMIPTGFALALPRGYEAQVRPRSGLAWKHGLTVLNSPGTIDADYRGEVKIVLVNLSDREVVIQPLDRIAQLVVAPVTRAGCEWVAELDDTVRGAGGYGSTG